MGVTSYSTFVFFASDLILPKFFRTCLFLFSAPQLAAVTYPYNPSLHPWFSAVLVTQSLLGEDDG